MKHLVVGNGEIGSALFEILRNGDVDVKIRDVDPVSWTGDVLHVCFPYSEDFVPWVQQYQQEHETDLVIVHSTVPVGTCDPHGWVHSPVTGRHPRLATSILTFTKRFGGERAKEAAALFWAIGVLNVAVYPRAAETEAGKLWELVQFGLQVRICQQIKQWCDDQGLDFDSVYTDPAKHYNGGYRAFRDFQYLRPVLEPMMGPIGGHCVVPGSKLLDHPLARMVTDGDTPDLPQDLAGRPDAEDVRAVRDPSAAAPP